MQIIKNDWDGGRGSNLLSCQFPVFVAFATLLSLVQASPLLYPPVTPQFGNFGYGARSRAPLTSGLQQRFDNSPTFYPPQQNYQFLIPGPVQEQSFLNPKNLSEIEDFEASEEDRTFHQARTNIPLDNNDANPKEAPITFSHPILYDGSWSPQFPITETLIVTTNPVKGHSPVSQQVLSNSPANKFQQNLPAVKQGPYPPYPFHYSTEYQLGGTIISYYPIDKLGFNNNYKNFDSEKSFSKSQTHYMDPTYSNPNYVGGGREIVYHQKSQSPASYQNVQQTHHLQQYQLPSYPQQLFPSRISRRTSSSGSGTVPLVLPLPSFRSIRQAPQGSFFVPARTTDGSMTYTIPDPNRGQRQPPTILSPMPPPSPSPPLMMTAMNPQFQSQNMPISPAPMQDQSPFKSPGESTLRNYLSQGGNNVNYYYNRQQSSSSAIPSDNPANSPFQNFAQNQPGMGIPNKPIMTLNQEYFRGRGIQQQFGRQNDPQQFPLGESRDRSGRGQYAIVSDLPGRVRESLGNTYVPNSPNWPHSYQNYPQLEQNPHPQNRSAVVFQQSQSQQVAFRRPSASTAPATVTSDYGFEPWIPSGPPLQPQPQPQPPPPQQQLLRNPTVAAPLLTQPQPQGPQPTFGNVQNVQSNGSLYPNSQGIAYRQSESLPQPQPQNAQIQRWSQSTSSSNSWGNNPGVGLLPPPPIPIGNGLKNYDMSLYGYPMQNESNMVMWNGMNWNPMRSHIGQQQKTSTPRRSNTSNNEAIKSALNAGSGSDSIILQQHLLRAKQRLLAQKAKEKEKAAQSRNMNSTSNSQKDVEILNASVSPSSKPNESLIQQQLKKGVNNDNGNGATAPSELGATGTSWVSNPLHHHQNSQLVQDENGNFYDIDKFSDRSISPVFSTSRGNRMSRHSRQSRSSLDLEDFDIQIEDILGPLTGNM